MSYRGREVSHAGRRYWADELDKFFTHDLETLAHGYRVGKTVGEVMSDE